MVTRPLNITRSMVAGKSFNFYRSNGDLIFRNLPFHPDGSFGRFVLQNEAAWEFEDGWLVFRDQAGNITSIFDGGELAEGRLTLHGRFLGSGSARYANKLVESALHLEQPAIWPTAPQATHVCAPPIAQPAAAVLIRTHKIDKKFQSLYDKLAVKNEFYDLYALIDKTRGIPEGAPSNTIWLSTTEVRELGLAQLRDRPLYRCGDMALFFAFRNLPNYRHYVMLDDDVDFVNDGSTYLQSVCMSLRGSKSDLDYIGLELQRYPPDKGHGLAAAKFFPPENIWYSYFPFVAMSRRAVALVYSQRLLESRRCPFEDDVISCEVFAATLMQNSGYLCADLLDLAPGSYDWNSVAMQLNGDRVGLPMSFKVSFPRQIELIHPVYTDEEFLRRAKVEYVERRRNDWQGLRNVLDGAVARAIPRETVEKFTADELPPGF